MKNPGLRRMEQILPFVLSGLMVVSILMMMGSPASATVDEYSYNFAWYDNNPAWGMNGDWIVISNRGTVNAADVKIEIGGTVVALYNAGNAIAPGAEVQWQSPTTVTNGPVKVSSMNGEPLGVSQRVLYKDSFNELNAVKGNDLENDYFFTWYDNNSAWGMNGNWICATNMGSQETMVKIYVGDISNTAIPVATLGPIPHGGHVEWQSPTTLTNGPVRVTSSNGQPLLAGQRVLYKNSFNEVTGVGASRPGGEAIFPWYDDNPAWGMNGNWLLVANFDDNGFDPARVQIKIGDTYMHDPLHPENNFFTIGPGDYITPQFPGVTNGPVHVTCSNCVSGQRLVISQRTIYKDSFEEIQGVSPIDVGSNWTYPVEVPGGESQTVTLIPGNDIGPNAWFNWYDANPGNGMLGDWVLVANPSISSLGVKIKIGTSYMDNPATGTKIFTVGPGGVITPSFAPMTDGPVSVECQNCDAGQKLVISQRVIYKNSFNEVIGRP